MPGTALSSIAADSAAGTEYDVNQIKSEREGGKRELLQFLLDGTLAGVKASHYAAALERKVGRLIINGQKVCSVTGTSPRFTNIGHLPLLNVISQAISNPLFNNLLIAQCSTFVRR